MIFTADYGIIQLTPEGRQPMKKMIRKTEAFKALCAEAREAIEAYANGADFESVVARLAPVGETMAVLLG